MNVCQTIHYLTPYHFFHHFLLKKFIDIYAKITFKLNLCIGPTKS